MSFNRIKCWAIRTAVSDVDAISTTPHDLDLIKKSILKNGYRAFFLNDAAEIVGSPWYREYLLGERAIFYIYGSGVYRLVNVDLTENELYFEKYNLPVGYKPWIFYSWQSDHDRSRREIHDAVALVIAGVNEARNPRFPLELVESTRPEDGACDIGEALRQNIDRSLLAVFDLTHVAEIVADAGARPKSYPNANVVFEFCYALHRKIADQVVVVKRDRAADLRVDDVPFDFRNVRFLSYTTPEQLNDELRDTIVDKLERMSFIARDAR